MVSTQTVAETPQAGSSTQEVLIDDIHVNEKKLRKLSRAKIEAIMEALEKGDYVPPIEIDDITSADAAERGEQQYAVQEGRHRLQAHRALGYRTVQALVKNDSEK